MALRELVLLTVLYLRVNWINVGPYRKEASLIYKTQHETLQSISEMLLNSRLKAVAPYVLTSVSVLYNRIMELQKARLDSM